MSSVYELKALKALNDYRDAKLAMNFSQMDRANDSFNDLILRVADNHREQELQSMMDALIDATADEALAAYAREAAKFGVLKDAFALHKHMLNGAQNDLFFPAASNELTKLAGTLSALKMSTEQLLASVDGVKDAFAKKDALVLVIEAMRSKAMLDGLIENLHALEHKLPQEPGGEVG